MKQTGIDLLSEITVQEMSAGYNRFFVSEDCACGEKSLHFRLNFRINDRAYYYGTLKPNYSGVKTLEIVKKSSRLNVSQIN